MPYIIKEGRHVLDIQQRGPVSVGELNYVLTTIVQAWIKRQPQSYNTYNAVLGILSAMQHELYRRQIAPYEDIKIKENGDVFINAETTLSRTCTCGGDCKE